MLLVSPTLPLPLLTQDARAFAIASLVMVTTVESVKALTGLLDRELTRKVGGN